MNRIDSKFKELKRRKKKAFVVYITAGDPNVAASESMALVLERSGADILELGIPFSDPMADGPTIQAASQRALENKMSMKKAFSLVKRIRRSSQIPIVFMTYYNPVLKYGLTEFFRSCREENVDGVIIPDLPCEESSDVIKLGRQFNVSTIFLVAPTSNMKRIKMIAANSTGFIYYVSLTGVTGARTRLPADLLSHIKKIKRSTSKPVCVGFGISSPSQARKVAGISDGVIVGSAIVKMIGDKSDALKNVSIFAAQMAEAVHNAK